MKALLCVCSVLLGLALLGCQSSTPNIEAKTHHYTLKQKCPTLLAMNVGEVLQFTAFENPSTGFEWKLLQPLKLFKTEETYLQKETDEGTVGAGGEKTFRFLAEKPGQALIELVHLRSWETSQQPEQQWQCRIRVS